MANICWSRKYEKCIKCGTNEIPHSGHGLCRHCYERERNDKYQATHVPAVRGDILPRITREYLLTEYGDKGRSLQDIATDLKCTRQYIYLLMEAFHLKRRPRNEARNLAVSAGKVEVSIEDAHGNRKLVKHAPLEIDREFFKKWSDNFAYVLGLIYTDGNLLKEHYSSKRKQYVDYYGISISQKDPEILEKVRKAMSLNRPVLKIKNNRDSYLHLLFFRDKGIFERLESIGLCPSKSLTITFPKIPVQYVGGFLRGLFDGDGSFYGGEARLTTGSEDFANGVRDVLTQLGFISYVNVTVRKSRSFSVRLSTVDGALRRFYKLLYKDAQLFIPRKRTALAASFHEDPHYWEKTATDEVMEEDTVTAAGNTPRLRPT